MSSMPKYPKAHVKPAGKTRLALRKAGVSNEEIEAFTREVISGDYDHVLRTVMKLVKTS